MEEESLNLRAEAEDPVHVPLAEELHSVTLTDQEICIQVSTCGPEPEPSNNEETQQVIEPPENRTEFELTNHPEFDNFSIEIESTEIELDFDQEPMSVDLSCSETIPDETSPLPDDLNNLDTVVVEIEADNSSDAGHRNKQSSDVETNTYSSTKLVPQEMDNEEVDTCSSPTSGLVPTSVLIEQNVLHSANSIDIPDPDMIVIQGESPALPGVTCSSLIVKEDTAADPMDSTDAPALADVSVPVPKPEVLNSQIESSHVPAVSMELELETSSAESEKPITKTTESSDKLEVSPLRTLEVAAESVKEEEDNDSKKPGPSTSPVPKTPKAKPAPSRTTRSAPMLRRRRRKRLMTRQRQTSAGSPNKQKPGSPQGKRASRKDAAAVKDDASPRRIVRKRKAGSSKQEKNAEQHEENAERPAVIPKRTFLSTETLMYEGIKYRIGDIVQLTGDDSLIYYAHILRFLTDDYCEKFILIRWLVPREGVPSIKQYHSTEFNPLYFAPGPYQEEPISMRDIEFVMRAPRNLGPGKCEPTFNKCGELAIIFNTNIPENTGTSIAHSKL